MSSAPVEYGDHPVADAAAPVHAELDELVDTAVWSMSPAVLARTLPALTRAKARVAEVELRVANTPSGSGWAPRSVPRTPPPGGPTPPG